MVDADATCAPNALQALIRAMGGGPRRPGGRPERREMTAMEVGHRVCFPGSVKLKAAWSHTFLEGSLMAFRANLMDPESFDVTSNADDAQIATAIAEQGYRTAQHPDAIFHDTTPRALGTRWDQRMRRGRGLIRLLRRKNT